MQKEKLKIFISYAHLDNFYTRVLIQELHIFFKEYNQFDFEVWEDSSLSVGDYWNETIINQLWKCDIGILLLSQNYFKSNYIKETELKILFERIQSNKNVLLFPIQISPCYPEYLKKISTLQIFKPKGLEFNYNGFNEFTYSDLFKPIDEIKYLPNPNIDRYHLKLFDALKASIKKKMKII